MRLMVIDRGRKHAINGDECLCAVIENSIEQEP